jgi:hypothetical protein
MTEPAHLILKTYTPVPLRRTPSSADDSIEAEK